jgi:putative ABC transport system permease protein
MTTIRVALRMARRDARRAKGRTALVLALIAIPVTLLSCLVTLFAQVPDDGPMTTVPLGGADAMIWGGPGWTDITQDQAVTETGYGASGKPFTAAQVVALIGPGTRVIPYAEGSLRYLTPYVYQDGEAVEIDLRDPMARGLFRLDSGRLPVRAGEAVAAEEAAEQGIGIGTTVYALPGRLPARIVGLGRYVADGLSSRRRRRPGRA